MVVLRLFTAILVLSSVLQVFCQSDDDQVAAILGKMSRLIRKKHNVQKPFQMEANEEVIAQTLLDNDLRLTVPQATSLLAYMQDEYYGGNVTEFDDGTEYVGHDKRVYPRTTSRWTFPIKYAFDGTHADSEKAIIRQGIALWQTLTCATFTEVSTPSSIVSSPGLVFTKGSGCWSYVGRTSSSATQLISLGSGCVDPGIAAHEVGHALGLWHEQMRNDRDNYIKINWANIITGYESAFAKVAPSDDNVYGTPYDYASVMHYNSLGFSIDYYGKKRVFEPYDINFLPAMGQRVTLSFNDAKRINMHYNCIKVACGSQTLTQPCQNGGYQDPKNCAKCRCPNGYGGDFCQTNAPASGASCGGVINLGACATTIISSPNYPNSYPARGTCSWLIQAPTGSGLVFAFEGAPRMPCNSADTCSDFVEIRVNKTDPTFTGERFCGCGQNNGRPVTTDNNQAVVYFQSYSSSGSAGFRLNVYATCTGTTASTLTKNCVISTTGFDYVGTRTTVDSGATCQPWAGQSSYGVFSFPDGTLQAAGQFCRNPDNRASPWCYTSSSYSSSGYCTNIPKCPTGSSPTTTTTASTTTTTTRAATTTTTTTTAAPTTTTRTTTTAAPTTTTRTTTTAAPTTTTRTTTTQAPSSTTTTTTAAPSGDCRMSVAGREYAGTVSVTVSGYACQRWDNQWPWTHNFRVGSAYPDGSTSAAKNYCRNPDPSFNQGVWCFTLNPNVRRELCNVPLCPGVTVKKRRLYKLENELNELMNNLADRSGDELYFDDDDSNENVLDLM